MPQPSPAYGGGSAWVPVGKTLIAPFWLMALFSETFHG